MTTLINESTLDIISPIDAEEKRAEEVKIAKASKYEPTAWDKFTDSTRKWVRLCETLHNEALTIADRLQVDAVKL